MGAKVSYTKGVAVLVKVPDGRGGHTLQSGKIKDTAGRGAIVRFTNGGHERFVFATELSLDTTETPNAKPDKVQPPAHFAPKPQPSLGQLLRAERVSRELTIATVAEMLSITMPVLTEFEDGGVIPSDDLVLKFADAIGANVSALVDALARDRASTQKSAEPTVTPPITSLHLNAKIGTTPGVSPFSAIDAWVARLRKLVQAIGTFKPEAEIVLTHHINERDPWKAQIAGYGEVGRTAGEAMGKLTAKLDESVAERIAARRKELADLESLSAAAR